MISIGDLVSLAKAGWTPHQVKEVLEMIETSPKVQEAAPEDLKPVEIKEEPKVESEPIGIIKDSADDDALETLKKLISEE